MRAVLPVSFPAFLRNSSQLPAQRPRCKYIALRPLTNRKVHQPENEKFTTSERRNKKRRRGRKRLLRGLSDTIPPLPPAAHTTRNKNREDIAACLHRCVEVMHHSGHPLLLTKTQRKEIRKEEKRKKTRLLEQWKRETKQHRRQRLCHFTTYVKLQ
jgi:hypothetical protein